MIEEPERTAELSRNCTLEKENAPERVSQGAGLGMNVYCQRPLDFAAVILLDQCADGWAAALAP